MTIQMLARGLVACGSWAVLSACVGVGGDGRGDGPGLRVSSAFISAPGGGGPASLYLRVENGGGEADWLLRAETAAAGTSTLHRQVEHGGLRMMMRADSLPVGAGEVVALRPGGAHVMLDSRNAALAEGDTVAATLWFRRAGKVEVRAVVAGPAEIARRLGTEAGGESHHAHPGGT